MKARIFAEESRKWWTLGAVAFALFMIMLDNTVVNVALPSIQSDLGIGLSELPVDGQRLRSDVRRAHARAASSPTSSTPARLPHRARDLHALVTRLRAGDVGRDPDRRPDRAGRGAALMMPAALDHLGHVPAAPARDGDRDLGGRLGDGPCHRPADRWDRDGAHRLELDLLPQRPHRHRRPDRRPACDRRVARHLEQDSTSRAWSPRAWGSSR